MTPRRMVPAPRSGEEIPEYCSALGLPGLIDLHVHFMPDSVQAKVWQYFDTAGDNTSLTADSWPIMYRQPEQARVATLAQYGVTHYATLNYAHKPGMAAWLNAYSTQFAQQQPGTVIHSATFYPEEDVVEQVRSALKAGAQIFKVHVQVGGFTVLNPLLEPVWPMLAEAGTPVVIHCGHGPERGTYTGIEPIRKLVIDHPELTLIIAHAGMPDYLDYADLASRHPNVYLDTTMVGTDFIESLMPMPAEFKMMLPGLDGKIVLGTDFPSIPYPYHHQIVALHRLGLGDDWMRNLLWHTPARLLGWA